MTKVTGFCNIVCHMESFSEWLEQERKRRNWSISELARQAGVTPSAMNRVINEGRGVGIDVCIGIARALGISIEEVIRRARPGELPTLTVDQEAEQEIIYRMRRLGHIMRDRARSYLRYLEYEQSGQLPPPARCQPTAVEMFEQLTEEQRAKLLELMQTMIKANEKQVAEE